MAVSTGRNKASFNARPRCKLPQSEALQDMLIIVFVSIGCTVSWISSKALLELHPLVTNADPCTNAHCLSKASFPRLSRDHRTPCALPAPGPIPCDPKSDPAAAGFVGSSGGLLTKSFFFNWASGLKNGCASVFLGRCQQRYTCSSTTRTYKT